MKLKIAKRRVRFKNLPEGLFYHEGILCLKTEYRDQSPTDMKYYPMAFICETGEVWYGGVGYYTQRDNLLVYPVTLEPTML